jgi:hypothetical protein
MSDSNDVSEPYERHRRDLAAANAHNKTVVFDALAAAGVTAVTVPFNGAGDSGQTGEVSCEPGGIDLGKTALTIRQAGWGAGMSEETATLPEAIETLCYGYLDQESGGWENDDGAFGAFTLDVAARTVTLEFNVRFTDYNTYEHSF